MNSEQDAYDELCAYTLTLGDATFRHQHVVDAYAVQSAGPYSKPIGVAFALAGLYLHVEGGFTGRQVQDAHRRMAREKRTWPEFALPAHRGAVSAREVLAASPGAERDDAIDGWCASVWEACAMHRDAVVELLRECRVSRLAGRQEAP